MFARTVVAAAASARLFYAMSRDNLLPGTRGLPRINPGTMTPVTAPVVSLVICLALVFYGHPNGHAFGTLVGATALIPYIVYVLTVVAGGLRRRRMDKQPDAFHLGRWATAVFVAATAS